jgi:predicted small integral membrane protein
MFEWIADVWSEISTKFVWMAWTWETAIFFGFIALALVILTLLAIYRPEVPRKGILGFPTTRGDRFFVTMLGAAYINILWIRFGGGELWYPLGISGLFGIAMFIFA